MKFSKNRPVEDHFHLQRLISYLIRIEENPRKCEAGVAPAALDWLNGEIAQIEAEMFPKKEKAAGQGDNFEVTYEKFFDDIIPLHDPDDKELYSQIDPYLDDMESADDYLNRIRGEMEEGTDHAQRQ